MSIVTKVKGPQILYSLLTIGTIPTAKASTTVYSINWGGYTFYKPEGCGRGADKAFNR